MQLRFLRKVYDAGGTLVPSTDTGAAPNQVPGFALHRELALFSEAGIPNAKVIELATSVAARVMRKDAEFGSIAPGKRADILVLGGDPIADINNTRRVEVAIKDGRRYEPQALLERAVAGA
jgi:imidazolonepropionase-like amidohydrolase